jgi:SAM-dependent methyltransferase
MGRFYRQADGDPRRLPWHRDTPVPLLTAAVRKRDGHGRVLDVGCGAGTFSVWLAEQGLTVTGLDLFPEAIAMGRALAEERGVDVEFIACDLASFTPDHPFDLVFDSGCLHSLVGHDITVYKRQLLTWLGPDGEFVLEHWGKLHSLDWRPVGPRRRSQATIERTFGPELGVVSTNVVDFAVPLPFGPTVRGVSYRFRRVDRIPSSAAPAAPRG